jgi:hypothetical protein
VYPKDLKTSELARQMENDLLRKGYQATSIFSDYSELGDERKGPAGSMRYVYTDATIANSVKSLLKSDAGGRQVLPDEVRTQMSADVRVLLF